MLSYLQINQKFNKKKIKKLKTISKPGKVKKNILHTENSHPNIQFAIIAEDPHPLHWEEDVEESHLPGQVSPDSPAILSSQAFSEVWDKALGWGGVENCVNEILVISCVDYTQVMGDCSVCIPI